MGISGRRFGTVLAKAVSGMAIGLAPATSILAQTPAAPIGDSVWIFPETYPAEAIPIAQMGPTEVVVAVAADGTAGDCHVRVPTGSASLDRIACRATLQRGRFVPARDAGGSAIASTYVATVGWGLWDETGLTDKRPWHQSLTLALEADGTPVECSTGRDDRSIGVDQAACSALLALAPQALAVAPMTGRAMLSAMKLWPDDKDAMPDQPWAGGKTLLEVGTTYDVAADGRISGCKTVKSGMLVDAALQPGDPCDAAGLGGTAEWAAGGVARRETAIWRITITPTPKMPVFTYHSDVMLIAAPGDAAPICRGAVRETESLATSCGYISLAMAEFRKRTGNTGRLEGHYRTGAREAATPPPATTVPARETVFLQWIRRYRIDDQGRAVDCTESEAGLSVQEHAGSGATVCNRMPIYDRGSVGDQPLWVVEDLHYTFRPVP